MKIAIRMDDITPGMDWAKFLRFKELCDLYQVKPLIGVVPENQDPMLEIDPHREDYWDYLGTLQKQGWTIAQHGAVHVYTTKKKGKFPLNALSEFAGVSYEKQYEMIKKGKHILESHGIHTDIFMAPAHSYDLHTLSALKVLGFRRITDGFAKKPYIWKDLIFYPISFKQSTSLKKKNGYTTFVVHTNTMQEQDFVYYEKLFSQQQHRMISYRDFLQVPAEKRNEWGHLKEYMLAKAKYTLVRIKAFL